MSYLILLIGFSILIFFLCIYWLKIQYKSYKEDQEELELMYYNDRTVFDYIDIHVDKNTPGKNNRYD